MGFCKVNAIQRSPLNRRPFKGLLKRERETLKKKTALQRVSIEEDNLLKGFYRRIYSNGTKWKNDFL